MPNKITSWSFSRYSTYKLCPFKAKCAFILKIKEPGNKAMQRGALVHDSARDFIFGITKTVPVELEHFKDLFKQLQQRYKLKINGMTVEQTWAFTKDWQDTVWNDWDNCWVRIKLDCAYQLTDTLLVIPDWKTGKFREEMNDDYVEQLELYALAALLKHPWVEEVRPRLVYLDQSIIYPDPDDPIIFTQDDVPMLKKLWEGRVKKMLSDTVFAPRPNDKCRYCFYSANQNGPCKF